ncbi:AI-2E family transporter [Ferruginibacter yonginensis]|uniref:AI-2E family transporter n=1 Tax=Ferruginibacter yonginensis TaxID=1310416 RepID=A0ABV8QT67_9BACT
MSNSQQQYPFYFKSTIILFGISLVCYALFVLSDILAPIAFSLVIAILLNPMVTKLQKRGVNKIVAISLAIGLAFLIVAGIIYFITNQIVNFGDNLPQLKLKFNENLANVQQWLNTHLNITIAKQQKLANEALNSSQALLGRTVGGALGILSLIFLIPIYVFLLLYYKTLIINFFHEVFAEENSAKVSEVLGATKAAIQSYMVGLLLEALVVAVLNSVALMIIGLDYAILIGVIGALLNMLPYIGGIIAIALPVILASVTKDGYSTQLAVVISYIVIQFVDNNFLVPFLVSSRVKINAFFSVLVVLLGGALWGISGMFLSIPFVAILKIIFDRLPEMKPWGKLLGDEVPTRHKGEIWQRKRLRQEASNPEKEKSL